MFLPFQTHGLIFCRGGLNFYTFTTNFIEIHGGNTYFSLNKVKAQIHVPNLNDSFFPPHHYKPITDVRERETLFLIVQLLWLPLMIFLRTWENRFTFSIANFSNEIELSEILFLSLVRLMLELDTAAVCDSLRYWIWSLCRQNKVLGWCLRTVDKMYVA